MKRIEIDEKWADSSMIVIEDFVFVGYCMGNEGKDVVSQMEAAFDELGVKKLPKVKDLSAEYAQVLADKKRMYAEYRHVRDEVQELLVAQRNIATLYTDDHSDEENRKKTHHLR